MLQIALSALISLGMVLGAINYTNEHSAVKFGANSTISALTALTSPAYDDVIAIVDSSPTPTTKKITWANATSSIKSDFDNIYAPKIGSTNITTLGTITTGTWNASILSAQYGGTGSSTLSSNRLFVGNGTGAVQSIASGNAGQYLISNGAGSAPTFQTASVDQAGTYTWTGAHTFNATTTVNATATFNGITYVGQFADYRASTTIDGVTSPKAVFVATSTNALWMSVGNIATNTDFLGFTRQSLTNGATGSVQISGIVSGFTGLTAGQPYYVQNTAGTIGTSMGTAELYVGTAISATQLLLDRKDANTQYIGTASCSINGASGTTCDISVPLFARHAYIEGGGFTIPFGACGSAGFTSNLVVSKIGHTSSTQNWTAYCNSSNQSNASMVANFLSASTLRITVNASGATGSITGTVTAYFYR